MPLLESIAWFHWNQAIVAWVACLREGAACRFEPREGLRQSCPSRQALVTVYSITLARHPDTPLMSLEPMPELAETLRSRFPEARIEERYAQDLPELTAAWGHPQIERVVSSLPWAIWPRELQQSVLDGVLAVMTPSARMVTFTYVHSGMLPAAKRFRETLESNFGEVQSSKVAWRNLPPAFVLICNKPRHQGATQGPNASNR